MTRSLQLADPNCEVTDSDYDAILSAIMESSRGRWFLSEYARRNRHADTHALVSALNNIKETLDFYRRASHPYLIKTAFSSACSTNQPGISVASLPPSKAIPQVRDKTVRTPIAPGNSGGPCNDIAADTSLRVTALCDENGAFEFKD
jgi:hypothetical protein